MPTDEAPRVWWLPTSGFLAIHDDPPFARMGRVGSGFELPTDAVELHPAKALDPLGPDDVHLVTLALPMTVTLLGDIGDALATVARRHGLEPPVVLTDGSGRVIARRTPTDPEETP